MSENTGATGRASSGESTVNVPSKKIVTPFPPLTEPLKDLAQVKYATLRGKEETTQVTTLSNGLRVASENRFGQFCTVGVVIDSGPRFEVAYPGGVSHFLEKLAFNVRFSTFSLLSYYKIIQFTTLNNFSQHMNTQKRILSCES